MSLRIITALWFVLSGLLLAVAGFLLLHRYGLMPDWSRALAVGQLFWDVCAGAAFVLALAACLRATPLLKGGG